MYFASTQIFAINSDLYDFPATDNSSFPLAACTTNKKLVRYVIQNIFNYFTIACQRIVRTNISFLLQLNRTIHTNLHGGWPYAGHLPFIYCHAGTSTTFPLAASTTGVHEDLKIISVDYSFVMRERKN